MELFNEEELDKDAFNVAMGRRLCDLRNFRGKSQKYVGAKLGVTYQQVHKYETGETTVSPMHLAVYAKIFRVPIEYLYGKNAESNDSGSQYDKQTLLVASEIMTLPEEIRKGVYHLSRQINKVCTNDKAKGKTQEQAA